jgi:hypothetical protein
MCQAKDHFIFCSCEDETQDSEENFYTWYLKRYVREYSSNVRGKIKVTKEDLGNGITREAICTQLNSNIQSFDFEYTPVERDTLQISVPDLYEEYHYFNLIFRDGNWQPGSNPVFSTINEKVAEGKIKKHNDWVKNPKHDLEALFSAYLANPNDKKTVPYLYKLIQLDYDFFYEKAQQFIDSKKRRERYVSVSIFTALFCDDYKFETIKAILFKFLKSKENRPFFAMIIYNLDIENEQLTASEIDFICSFKNLDKEVKLSIMHAFIELKHEKIIDILIEFSSDTNAEVRETALYYLEDMIDTKHVQKIKKAFWARVEDSDQKVRIEAMTGLAEFKETSIKEAVLKEISKRKVTDWDFYHLIENVDDKRIIPYLEARIEKLDNPYDYTYKSLVEKLEDLQKL